MRQGPKEKMVIWDARVISALTEHLGFQMLAKWIYQMSNFLTNQLKAFLYKTFPGLLVVAFWNDQNVFELGNCRNLAYTHPGYESSPKTRY